MMSSSSRAFLSSISFSCATCTLGRLSSPNSSLAHRSSPATYASISAASGPIETVDILAESRCRAPMINTHAPQSQPDIKTPLGLLYQPLRSDFFFGRLYFLLSDIHSRLGPCAPQLHRPTELARHVHHELCAQRRRRARNTHRTSWSPCWHTSHSRNSCSRRKDLGERLDQQEDAFTGADCERTSRMILGVKGYKNC